MSLFFPRRDVEARTVLTAKNRAKKLTTKKKTSHLVVAAEWRRRPIRHDERRRRRRIRDSGPLWVCRKREGDGLELVELRGKKVGGGKRGRRKVSERASERRRKKKRGRRGKEKKSQRTKNCCFELCLGGAQLRRACRLVRILLVRRQQNAFAAPSQEALRRMAQIIRTYLGPLCQRRRRRRICSVAFLLLGDGDVASASPARRARLVSSSRSLHSARHRLKWVSVGVRCEG